MRSLFHCLAYLLLAQLAAAQEMPLSTVVVPVVGSTLGVSEARWLTDVELVNDTGAAADVAIELVAVPEAPAFFLTLAPGQVQRFTDIVGQAFGLESALSPLRVTTGGRRPISVRAHAYAVHSEDVSPMQNIDVYASTSWFPIRVLDGLAFSDKFRTNVGLLNLGDRDAEFVLALQRLAGRNVAVTQLQLAPGSLLHTSIQTLFPLITEGDGFSLVIETSSRDSHVYASVIRNSDDAARFITPRIGTR